MTKTKEKNYAFDIYVVGRALIKNKDKYLLLKRDAKESYGGQWELPGGKLETLERIKMGVIREIFEETSLVIEISTNNAHVSSYLAKEGGHAGSTYTNIIYVDTKIVAGKLKTKSEHQAFGWFTKKEIFNLDLTHYTEMPLTETLLPR